MDNSMIEHKEFFQDICEPKLEAIKKSLDSLQTSMESINRRLFIDNGVPCHSTRIDRLERSQGIMSKFVWLLVGGAITITGFYLKKQIIG